MKLFRLLHHRTRLTINCRGNLSPFLDPIVDRNTTDICEIKQLRNQAKSTQIYHIHLNINSIRNKFEPLVRFVGNNLDIYFSIRDKNR